jgi:hypothetical protein
MTLFSDRHCDLRPLEGNDRGSCISTFPSLSRIIGEIIDTCFSTTVPGYHQILDLDFKLQEYEASLSVPSAKDVEKDPNLIWLSKVQVLGKYWNLHMYASDY